MKFVARIVLSTKMFEISVHFKIEAVTFVKESNNKRGEL